MGVSQASTLSVRAGLDRMSHRRLVVCVLPMNASPGGCRSPPRPNSRDAAEEEDGEELEEMVQDGPAGKEWGGPTRGGRYREPTRFGDWERKGRCSDF